MKVAWDWKRVPFVTALCLAASLLCLASPARAQTALPPFDQRTFEVDGEPFGYSIRAIPVEALSADPGAPLAPTSALETAKLLNRFLAAGRLEDAALLSNSPRRRFEVLRDYKDSIGEEGFKQVFTEYFQPGNKVMAEVEMGSHSLLIWQLRGPERITGQFYVRVEDRVLIDDIPNTSRTQLRRILEAIRTGALRLPAR
jgi:hypothetical protein